MADEISIQSVLNLDVRQATKQAMSFASKPLKLNFVVPSEEISKNLNETLSQPYLVNTQVDSDKLRTTVQTALSEPFDIAISSNITTQLEASAQNIGQIFATELGAAISEIKVSQDKGGLLGGITNLVASPIKAITRGFQEGIGLTAAQEIFSGTIKGVEKEFDVAFNKIGQKTGETLGKIGQGVADFTLKSLGTSSKEVLGVFEQLKVGWAEIWDTSKAEQQIDRIAASINVLLKDLIDKKPSLILKADLEDIGEEIKRYQGIAREGLDFKKQVEVIDSAKTAQEMAKGIEVGKTDKEAVALVGGGFGKKGEAQSNADQLAAYLQGLIGDIAEIVPMANEAIATNKTAKENTPIWAAEVLGKLAEFNVMGKANADAITMAATAIAIRRDNPDVPISLVGHSGGGLVAEEALAILKQAGMSEGVTGVGVGTPRGFFADPGAEESYQGFLGEFDPIRQLTEMAGSTGIAQMSASPQQNLPGFTGHDFVDYLSQPDVQEAIFSSLGIDKADTITKEDILQNLGIDPSEFKQAADQQKIDLHLLSEAYQKFTNILNQQSQAIAEKPEINPFEERFNLRADEFQRLEGAEKTTETELETVNLLKNIRQDSKELEMALKEADAESAATLNLLKIFYKQLESKFDFETQGIVKIEEYRKAIFDQLDELKQIGEIPENLPPITKGQAGDIESDVVAKGTIDPSVLEFFGKKEDPGLGNLENLSKVFPEGANLELTEDQVKIVAQKAREALGFNDKRFAAIGLSLSQLRPYIEQAYEDYLNKTISEFKEEIENKLSSLPVDVNVLSVDEIKGIFKSFGSESLKDNLYLFREALKEGNGEIAKEVGEALLKQIATAKILTAQFRERLDESGREYINAMTGKASQGALTNFETEVLQGTNQKGRSPTGLLTSGSVFEEIINDFLNKMRQVESGFTETIETQGLQEAISSVFNNIQLQDKVTQEQIDIAQEYVNKLTAIVASLSNLDITREQVPKIGKESDLLLGSSGGFDEFNNTINISSDLIKKMATNVDLATHELETLIHEIRHAAQIGFTVEGQAPELLTSDDPKIIKRSQQSTEMVVRQQSGGEFGIEDAPQQFQEIIKTSSERETDAYKFAQDYVENFERLLKEIETLEKQGLDSTENIIKAFKNVFEGVDDNIIKNWDNTIDAIRKNITNLTQFTDEQGYEIQRNLSEGSPGITKNIRDNWDKTVAFVSARVKDFKTITEVIGKEIENELGKTPDRLKAAQKAVEKGSQFAFDEVAFASRSFVDERKARKPQEFPAIQEQPARISDEFIEDVRSIIEAGIILQKDVAKTGAAIAVGGVKTYLPDIKQFFKLVSVIPEEIVKALPSTKNIDVQDVRQKTKEFVDQIKDFGNEVGVNQVVENIQQEVVGAVELSGGVLQELTALIPGFDQVNQMFERVTGGAINFQQSLLGLGSAVAVFAGVSALIENFDFVVEITQATIAVERLQTSLEFTAGSAEKGAKGLAFVTEEAKRLKVAIESSVEGYQQLSAAAQGNEELGKLTNRTTSAILQASRALNLSVERQDRAITALVQTGSKTNVSQEELKGQLAEALPNAISISARAFGVLNEELNKLVEEGLDATTFLTLFSRQLNQETYFAAIQASQTLGASFQNLQNQILLTRQAIGTQFSDEFKLAMNVAANGLELVSENAELLSFTLKVGLFAGAIGLFKLTQVAFPFIIKGLGQINQLLGVTDFLTSKVNQNVGSLTPTFDKMGIRVQTLGKALKGVDNFLGGMLDNLGKNPRIIERLLIDFRSFPKILNSVNQGVGNFFKGLQNLAIGGLNAVQGLLNGIGAVAAALGPMIATFVAIDAAINLTQTVLSSRRAMAEYRKELAKVDLAVQEALVETKEDAVAASEARQKAFLKEQSIYIKGLNVISNIRKAFGGRNINEALLDRQIEIDNTKLLEANQAITDFNNLIGQAEQGEISGEALDKALVASQFRLDALKQITALDAETQKNIDNTTNALEENIKALTKAANAALGLSDRYGEIGKARIQAILASEDAERLAIAAVDAQIRQEVLTIEEGELAKLKAKEARIAAQLKAEKEFLKSLNSKSEVEDRKKVEEKINELTQEGYEARSEIRQRELAEIEAMASETINRITVAEQERIIKILELEKQGVINKEQAEKLKGEATLERIKAELKAETEKLKAIAELNGKDSEEYIQQQQARNQKVIELINAEINGQKSLSNSVRNTAREVENATDSNIENRQREISVIQSQLDLSNQIQDQIQQLEEARFNVFQGSVQAETTLGDLRIDQLRRALEIRQQLASEESENLSSEQRQLLLEELAALGVDGRRDEQSILQEIAQIEEENGQRKLELLEKEFEFRRKIFELETKQNEIEAQQNKLDAESKVLEAEEKLAQAETEEQIKQAQKELELAQQQLELANANIDALKELTELNETQLEQEEKTATATAIKENQAADFGIRGEIAEANRDEIALVKAEEKRRIKEAKEQARNDKEARANLTATIKQIKEETKAAIQTIKEQRIRENNIRTPFVNPSPLVVPEMTTPDYYRPPITQVSNPSENLSSNLTDIQAQIKMLILEIKNISKPTVTNNVNVENPDNASLIRNVGNAVIDAMSRSNSFI